MLIFAFVPFFLFIFHVVMNFLYAFCRGLQTAACEDIVPTKENNIFTKNVFDLVECNISRNNHITHDVRSSNYCVIAYVALRQKSLETLERICRAFVCD